jgi:Flp pilus assembly protein TadD
MSVMPENHGPEWVNGRCKPAAGSRPGRRWRRLAATGLVVVGALVLASCSSGGTSEAHATPPSVLPTLDKAIHDEIHGQYAAAVADFLVVVKADPKNQIAWYDLGVIADRDSETSQAERDYRAAIAADATYVPALYNLAVLVAPTEPRQAIPLYRKAIAKEPNDADARLNLGFALLAIGQKAAGRAQIAEAIKLDPKMAARVPVADGGTA